MNSDRYALLLGKLLGNLQSLEFVLRAYLDTVDEAKPTSLKSSRLDLSSLKAGDRVPANPFTDYSTLGQLIDRCKGSLQIDRSVVDVRDSLAHGRIAAGSIDGPMLLLRFSNPKKGPIEVVNADELTDAWLTAKVRLVRNQIDKVRVALEVLNSRPGL